jgi:hypothetical protein
VAGYLVDRYSTSFREPEPPPRYTLIDAAEQEIVTAEFLGTGYCSGDVIQMKVESEVEFELEIEIKPGWILINSGSGQNMIIAEELTVTVKPGIKLDMKIECYCLDIDKTNPSSQETLSLRDDPGTYGPKVAELMRFTRTAPATRKSLKAVQIALWVLLGDVSRIPLTHSESDILDAKWLLENIGMDVSERTIFQIVEKSEEEILAMFETEYYNSATAINMVLTTEDFQIAVTEMGIFSRYVRGTEFERTFRADLKVSNMKNESEYFSVSDTTLITTEGLSYNVSFRGTFTSGYIEGGENKEGYLLFSEVPESVSIARLVVGTVYIFDFEKDETYTLMAIYEEMYLQSAMTIEQTITKGDFSITLVRVGNFTHLEYDTFGDEVTQFRVDLKVTSISSELEYIFLSDIRMVDNLGNEYNRQYGGTLDLGQIPAGVTREGYLLFPALNKEATRITVVVTHPAIPEFDIYEFTVDLE